MKSSDVNVRVSRGMMSPAGNVRIRDQIRAQANFWKFHRQQDSRSWKPLQSLHYSNLRTIFPGKTIKTLIQSLKISDI